MHGKIGQVNSAGKQMFTIGQVNSTNAEYAYNQNMAPVCFLSLLDTFSLL